MHATSGHNLVWYAVQGSSGVTDPAEIDKLCAEGRDAAKFLTQYVVQAELNERGNYGAMFCYAHSSGLHTFSLRDSNAGGASNVLT